MIEKLENRVMCSVSGLSVIPGKVVSNGKTYDTFTLSWKLAPVPTGEKLWGEVVDIYGSNGKYIGDYLLTPGNTVTIAGPFVPGDRYSFGVAQVDYSGNNYYESPFVWTSGQAKE